MEFLPGTAQAECRARLTSRAGRGGPGCRRGCAVKGWAERAAAETVDEQFAPRVYVPL